MLNGAAEPATVADLTSNRQALADGRYAAAGTDLRKLRTPAPPLHKPLIPAGLARALPTMATMLPRRTNIAAVADQGFTSRLTDALSPLRRER